MGRLRGDCPPNLRFDSRVVPAEEITPEVCSVLWRDRRGSGWAFAKAWYIPGTITLARIGAGDLIVWVNEDHRRPTLAVEAQEPSVDASVAARPFTSHAWRC